MKRVKPDDAIVAEVRRARAEIFAECGNDLRRLFAKLGCGRRSNPGRRHARPASVNRSR